MNIADWLTYTDIDQLKKLNQVYGCNANHNSKRELICALLQQMNGRSFAQESIQKMTDVECRFLQLIVLDTNTSYTMEELIAKGRGALAGEEGEPRKIVVSAIKKGWLFRGYSHRTQNLYQVPTDTKERFLNLFLDPFRNGKTGDVQLDFYRDEENLMRDDLYHLLGYVQREIVRLSGDGSIYKNQQKLIFEGFCVREEPITYKGPRFGFGRNYHLYPDRFSLLYDYAFYKGYLSETDQGYVGITDIGADKLFKKDPDEGKNLYRFWVRLYRRPITHLPVIIRWISLLVDEKWFLLDQVSQATSSWIFSYYYESAESLFQRVIKMLLHLGVIKMGTDGDRNYVALTRSGLIWLRGVSAFDEKTIEDGFIRGI